MASRISFALALGVLVACSSTTVVQSKNDGGGSGGSSGSGGSAGSSGGAGGGGSGGITSTAKTVCPGTVAKSWQGVPSTTATVSNGGYDFNFTVVETTGLLVDVSCTSDLHAIATGVSVETGVDQLVNVPIDGTSISLSYDNTNLTIIVNK